MVIISSLVIISIFSGVSRVSCQDLAVTAYPAKLKGLVNEVLNLTVYVDQTSDEHDLILQEIFWEPTISYITPVNTDDLMAYAGKV